MRTRKRHSIIVIIMTVAVLFVASITFVMASTGVKKLVYQGNGKATVYFKTSVKYDDSVKVTVKDNSNKTYKTVIKSKSSSKLQFQIKSYKTGKTYKVTVKGLGSGDAVTSFKIYSKTNAIKTAKSKSKAKSIKNVKTKSTVYRDYAVWKITFTGKVSGVNRSFTYLIKQQTGQVMYHNWELV